jgi:hypothetical protein
MQSLMKIRSFVLEILHVDRNTCFLQLNPLNAKVNPICHLLALLGAHLIFHVSCLRVNVANR